MPLPPQAIEEFRAIWKQQYGEDLPLNEAVARAHEFLGVVRLVLRRAQDLAMLDKHGAAAPVDIVRCGETYPGAHAPVLTMAEFQEVQRRLDLGGKARPQKAPFALTGMFRCGSCACMMTAETHTKRQQNGNVHHYVYYRCTKKRGPCPAPFVNGKDLDAQVLVRLQRLVPDPAFYTWAMAQLGEEDGKEREAAEAQRRSTEQSLRNAETEMKTLTTLRLQNHLTDEEYLGHKNEITVRIASLKEVLANADRTGRQAATQAQELLAFARNLTTVWPHTTIAERKQVLSAIGSNLAITDGIVQFQTKKPFLFLESPGGMHGSETASLEPRDCRLLEQNIGALVSSHSGLVAPRRIELRFLG